MERERRPQSFVSFTDPTQKAGIEDLPEMKLNPNGKLRLPVTGLGLRYN